MIEVISDFTNKMMIAKGLKMWVMFDPQRRFPWCLRL